MTIVIIIITFILYFLLRRREHMRNTLSKNAQRQGAHKLTSRWGGNIDMHSMFKDGKIHHYAECSKTHNRARKPGMLM